MTAAAFSFPDIGIVEPRSAALPEMATAVMVLNEMREVEFANDSARALFDGVEVTGCTLPGLLTICDVKGGMDFLETVGDVPVLTQGRLSLCDGRFVDAILKPLSTGGYVLTFDDVTAYMRDAELAQKDALTGLQNRASLHERLQEMLARAKTNRIGGRRHLPRPRPLQGGQRHAGPSGRRCPAAQGVRAPDQRGAGRRRRGTPRGRRVRDPASRYGPAAGGPDAGDASRGPHRSYLRGRRPHAQHRHQRRRGALALGRVRAG